MKETKSLLIIRHGSTKLNDHGGTQDKVRGWVDVPLNREGRQQALEAAKQIEAVIVDKLFTSDLHRGKDTASEIGEAVGSLPIPSRRFRPWNLGDWQGESSAKVQPEIEKFVSSKPEAAVPGGESFDRFKERALGGLQELIHRAHTGTGAVVLVTHYRVLQLLRAWLADKERSTTGPNDLEIEESVFFPNAKDCPPGAVMILDCSGPTLPRTLKVMDNGR